MLSNLNRVVSTTYALAVSGTSTPMATGFPVGVRGFMINANTAIHFAVDTTPVATSAGTTPSPFLPANETNYFNATPGQKVAAVTAATNGLVTSTNGTVFITPVE